MFSHPETRSRLTLHIATLLLVLWVQCPGTAYASEPVPVEHPPDKPLGLHAEYLKEQGPVLDINQAIAAYRHGEFRAGDAPVLDFGIGSRPVWIHLPVENRSNAGLLRRLAVQTPWLDKVDVYFVTGENVQKSYKLGDAQPFAQRPINSRFFEIEHTFEPGIVQIYIRVQTSDPMAVPLYLRTTEQAIGFERWQNYSYGFLYGFLMALLAYNAVLYFSLRIRRYIYYSLYLAVFMLTNFAYTGHGFAWVWPEQVEFQLWIIPFLITLYCLSGLLFASSFLDTEMHFPRLHRMIVWICALYALLLLGLFRFEYNALHMAAAFLFVGVFSVLMLLLGVLSVRAGNRAARYFLAGAIAAMTGASLTALSVAGFISYNALTYRAAEIGMLIDATILALALAYQFRVNQDEKFRAERMARLDPLTGLNNRRAFYEIATPIWSTALRRERDVTVMLLDIDHFKRINDTYGHAAGDDVLIAVANLIAKSARKGDVTARWGGEEFILFLPETNLDEGIALAERLRTTLSERIVKHPKGMISFTASFGVAQRSKSPMSIEELTSIADKCLYHAKHQGRNRVSYTYTS